jgi:hypothetical protein
MGFVVDKMALGQVLSGYFGFPCQSFHRLLHIHHPSSGAGTVGETVDSVSLHPLSQKLIIGYVTSQLPRLGNCCIIYAFLYVQLSLDNDGHIPASIICNNQECT